MNDKYLNDYELIYLISLGDELALNQLVLKYKGIMLHSLNEYKAMLYDKFDKSELYQVALISLHQSILTYNENMDCSFFTYFKIVVHHGVLAYIRSQRRDRSKANLYSISLDQCVKESEGIYLIDTVENNQAQFNPIDYTCLKQWNKNVLDTLRACKPQEVEIFLMWYQGYRYEEIATTNVVSLQHVSYVVSKIKKKLKGLIDYKDAL